MHNASYLNIWKVRKVRKIQVYTRKNGINLSYSEKSSKNNGIFAWV